PLGQSHPLGGRAADARFVRLATTAHQATSTRPTPSAPATARTSAPPAPSGLWFTKATLSWWADHNAATATVRRPSHVPNQTRFARKTAAPAAATAEV